MARVVIHVPLWVDYSDDPKIIEAGEKAELLFIRALCMMKRTLSDGFVSDSQLPRFGLSGVKMRAQTLVDQGLWVRVEGGYYCPSFLKWNKSRAEVEALSEKRSRASKARANREQVDEQVADTLLPIGKSETESETETETKSEGESADAPRPRASRIPVPFKVDPEMQMWVTEECPGLDWDTETKQFVDYWRAKSGKDATKLDWLATWRRWMRRSHQGAFR